MPSPNSDRYTYPPANKCIYCGKKDCDLSAEHIVAYALNGQLVLPKASCPDCSKRTQKTEEICASERGGMFYGLRARHRMKSRTKSTQKEARSIEIMRDGSGIEIQKFPTKSIPVAAFGIELPMAGILSGMPPSSHCKCKLVLRTQNPTEDFRPDGPVLIGKFNPTAFIQMIAKIGLAYAAAERPDAPTLPMLSDIILWKENKALYLVGGGGLDQYDGEETDYLHRLEICDSTAKGRTVTIVTVHLFGQLGLPKYHVVVRDCPAQ